MSEPRLHKARRLRGKSLVFHDAGVQHAGFIHQLRLQARNARFLQPTSPLLADQVSWLQAYGARKDEAYFVIADMRGELLGTVRMTGARGESFSWGSWTLKQGAPAHAAIESALMVFRYALDELGFQRCHFHVRSDNARVCAFHERLGAVREAQHGADIDYSLSNNAIRQALQRYARYLPGPLTVEV